MLAFLEETANYLSEKYGDQLSKLCLVFPNKRARLYFNNYLIKNIDKPVWSPSYFTITEFVEEISGLQVADNLLLTFELYNTYKQVTKSAQNFDDFYFFCEMLLSDFDDIDKYLVNPKDLFQNLSALKNYENYFSYLTEQQVEIIKRFWNTFNPEHLSEHQEGFVSLWEVLDKIYSEFNTKLDSMGLSYEGKLFRHVVKKIDTGEALPLDYEKIIFVGFNALNVCERKIFRHLKTVHKAIFLWDYDEYYTNNEIHEAGYFLRKNRKEFPAPEEFSIQSQLTSPGKEITFVSASSTMGQVKILPDLLSGIAPEEDLLSKTAIVLADERLLLPVLYSLPETLSELNVSMGYPFNDTPAFSLIEIIIGLQRNAKRSGEKIVFYYKDVLAFINHQYIINVDVKTLNAIKNKIIEENKIYISQQELLINGLFHETFRQVENVPELPDYISYIFGSILQLSKKGEILLSSVQLEFIYQLFTYLKRLKDVLSGTGVEINRATFLRLLYKLLQNLTVPFSGEPLKGLQVMGILETRTLDFENIIVLSMNEGLFPKSVSIPSFIPNNLRIGFGLPTSEHQDAIYAYYFYRLLHRSKNIFLVYNSQPKGMLSGERSRFLHQLFYEPVFRIKEISYSLPVTITLSQKISIKKTEYVLKRLERFTGPNGAALSPSALNTYIDCSLKFYFRYILGVKEPDDITEDIDLPSFGNILHKVMNKLYEPYFGSVTDSAKITTLLQNKTGILDKAVDESFKEEYFKFLQDGEPVKYAGRHQIIKEIILKYTEQILQVDAKISPFEIIDLEKGYYISLELKGLNGLKTVNIGGIIDRIDRVNGKIRIIDYKTGQVKNSFKGIESLFINSDPDRNHAVFQTFLYSFILSKSVSDPICPGLYFIREFYDENNEYHIFETDGRTKTSVEDFKTYKENFQHGLTTVLQEIFNPDNLFQQTEEQEICKNCTYKIICHRDR
ncbi:MAG: PD-(D/E)XK nuclease family protein [Bacteroidales bacterium]|nr:PD-(D/E)XK nuclease family protein [Bacteroidales bacterium]